MLDFIELASKSPEQGRTELIENKILMDVAKQRTEDMFERKYIAHTNLDGYGPNLLVNKAGYTLPNHYMVEDSSNHIESLSGGHKTAYTIFNGFLNSPGHKKHILGQSEHFASQTNYGCYFDIGEIPYNNSKIRFLFTFITAPPIKEKENYEYFVPVTGKNYKF